MNAIKVLFRSAAFSGLFVLSLHSSAIGGPPPHAPVTLSTGKKLAVPLYGQQTSVWCWDASSLMVIKYYRPTSPLKQCDLANQATNVTSCCNTPIPSECVHTGWEMLSSNGFAFDDSTSPLSWNDLRWQIDHGFPVLYAWGWNGGGGHMMVAIGHITLGKLHWVVINNPWPPSSSSSSGGAQETYTYDAWVGGTGYDHVFWHDWYNIVDKQRRYVHPPIAFPSTPIMPVGPGPVERATVIPEYVLAQARRTLDEIRSARPDVQTQLGLGAGAASRATLGTPLREYMVTLDALRSYKSGENPARIVAGGNEYLFPIVAGGTTASSVRVVAVSKEQAQTESIGNVALARRISTMPSISGRTRKFSRTAINAVKVPALGLYLIARVMNGKLQLASLYDESAFRIHANEYEDAAQIFGRLAAIARREKGAM